MDVPPPSQLQAVLEQAAQELRLPEVAMDLAADERAEARVSKT